MLLSYKMLPLIVTKKNSIWPNEHCKSNSINTCMHLAEGNAKQRVCVCVNVTELEFGVMTGSQKSRTNEIETEKDH